MDKNNSKRQQVPVNEVIPADDSLLEFDEFIPGKESQNISNLGGMIHGEDFDGNRFKFYSQESAFLQYICRPSSMSLLCDQKPFQKYEFEQLIKNPNIDNKYLLNRLLYSAHVGLKDINGKHVPTEEEHNKMSDDEKTAHKKT